MSSNSKFNWALHPSFAALVVVLLGSLLSGCVGSGNIATRPAPPYEEGEEAVTTVVTEVAENGVVVKKTTKTTSMSGLEVARQAMHHGDDVIFGVGKAKADASRPVVVANPHGSYSYPNYGYYGGVSVPLAAGAYPPPTNPGYPYP